MTSPSPKRRKSSSSSSTTATPTSFFANKPFVTAVGIPRDEIEALYSLADDVRSKPAKYERKMSGKVLALVFLEPSTRTQSSFAAAMQRLGGGVVAISKSDSSLAKGETESDTLKCLECYADGLVLRHSRTGSAREFAGVLSKPLINAGDGSGEHPTQALLDLYTILREAEGAHAKKLMAKEGKKLVVTFLGDAKYGRTVHSLSKLLGEYAGERVKLIYVTPTSELVMPREIVEEISSKFKVEQLESREMTDDILKETDVLYVTRVQKERFTDDAAYEAAKASFRVDAALLSRAPENMTVMHPLPRVGEIDPEVDGDARCAYFRQMENGMWVRAALILKVLGGM